MPGVAVPTVSESFLQAIEQAWGRTLAIAQNHVQAFDDQNRQPQPPADTHSNRASSEFYDRERLMMQALDTLFTYAHDGPGYLAFIQTLVSILDPESPVSMAFLSHIIERSALPSKQTMESVSPVIFQCMKQPPKILLQETASTLQRLMWSMGLKSKPVSRRSLVKVKLNATVIWALLAEKYAGDMCMHMWNDQVGQILIHTLQDPNEDLTVRIFALLALEKFSLTGSIKNIILDTSDIQLVLEKVNEECEKATQRLYASTYRSYKNNTSSSSLRSDPSDSKSMEQPPSLEQDQQPLTQDQDPPFQVWTPFKHAAQQMARLLKKPPTPPIDKTAKQSVPPFVTKPTRKQLLNPLAFKSNSSLRSFLSPSRSHKKHAWYDQNMNVFDVGIIPPQGKLRETWAKYIQLGFCARWALENVFNQGKKKINSSRWDMTDMRAMMNPFDSTPHWKFGDNGLELRNDRPHFESIRGTASVKTGKWYYETLLLSSGIMQLGWATSRCRFTPEEGYGVGDDCNGFAFDTYRTAVWADGTAVYPQSRIKIRCNSGDVLGSFLDLDNGLCSYFINGKDLGLTIEFENPTKQAAKANAAAAASLYDTAAGQASDQSDEINSSNSATASNTVQPPTQPLSADWAAPLDQSNTSLLSSSLSTTSSRNSDTSITTSSAIQQSSLRYKRQANQDDQGRSGAKQPSPVTLSTSANSPVLSSYHQHGYSSSTSSSGSSEGGSSVDALDKVVRKAKKSRSGNISPQHKPAKGLGLYPAVSLTTHQHIIINLGDQPWLYPPPVTCRYRGISEAGHLDSDYRRRVLRWVNQRGYRIRKLTLAENYKPIRPRSRPSHCNSSLADDDSSSTPVSGSSSNSTDSLVEYDWDGPLCTICFSEPKNSILLPCHHGGIGERCAKVLDMCHLCRSEIEDRVITETSGQDKDE
ncbi:hypothetical protein DM01DRAFT_1411716 [Hesseltinella vesiculosa]|uniref:B30.2/SPRY domain-containing protein n=1 Tax=Hesseltinella vesiculosa TaxID=101127 RepID=A0A1X2G2M9_9FUNG|nr:hypothetical protein DM01DRAFT_1411716 [Hesseltinella vesiculosa]